MKTNALKIAALSVMCTALGTAAFADNRTGGGPSNADPSRPGSPANIANTGSNASTDADRNGDNNATPMAGQADQQVASALRQVAADPETAPAKLFVLEAAGNDTFEIEFARLAEQKAQDPQVKELARMIQKDHEGSLQQLKAWSSKMNLSLPEGLPAAKQAKLAIFRSLSTEQFETGYVVANKAGHAMALSTYRDHAKLVREPGLHDYIVATLPKLEHHSQMIQQVASAKKIGDEMPAVGQGNTGNTNGMSSGTNSTATDPGNMNDTGRTGTAGAGDK